MTQHSDETALGETTPPAAHPFGNPDGPTDLPDVVRSRTVEEILAMARRPEKHARVCLRADLEARLDRILGELVTLVTPQGELIEDPEASMGEQSAAARARALNDDATAVRREMNDAMWFPLFRGMSSEDIAVFNKKHFPKNADKDGNVDLSEYNILLTAECSVEPKLSDDDVRRLKSTLGSKAYKALTATAQQVCTEGGVDVPKSPLSLRNLTLQ